VSVATTYADALHGAAADQESVDEVARDLEAFTAAMRESRELGLVLRNPDIEQADRRAVIEALTEDAHPLIRNFLLVLLDRGRLPELPEIERAFAAKVTEAEGRIEVHAITAVPLTDDLRRRVIAKLEEKTGRRVELSESVDPEIIGGLVLEFGTAVVDASLRTRLGRLGAALRTAPVEAATAA
jgi:F-type H+-transporting ATPase subunit delta